MVLGSAPDFELVVARAGFWSGRPPTLPEPDSASLDVVSPCPGSEGTQSH